MKVLFITNIPSPYRINFFNELAKLCDLTVCFERIGATDRDKSWEEKFDTSFKTIFLKGINVSNDKAYCPAIKKVIRGEKYDIIVVSGYSSPTAMTAISYMRKNNIPYILSSDGGIIKDNGTGIKHKIKSHFIKGAHGYLSTSGETDKYLIHYGADKNKLYRYPFTSLYEKDIFEAPATIEEKSKLREALNIPKDCRIIISVGRFIESKGFDVLIKASSMLDAGSKAAKTYIVGGKPTNEYNSLISEYNAENVHFIDFKAYPELVQLYRASDVFVLPTRTDVWGLVINEAMASGLPIITTDMCVAGVSLVTCGENGEIIPIDDEKKLAESIDKWISKTDSELYTAGEKSIETIKNYTFEVMAKRHMEIFEGVR